MQISLRFREGQPVAVDVLLATVKHGATRRYIRRNGTHRPRGWWRLTWRDWRDRPGVKDFRTPAMMHKAVMAEKAGL